MQRSTSDCLLVCPLVLMACTPASDPETPADEAGGSTASEDTGSTGTSPDTDSTAAGPLDSSGTSAASSTDSPGSSDSSDSSDSTGSTGSTGSSGSGVAPDCAGEPVMHFVYFVEADEAFSEQQRSDIESFAFEFQQYWYEQLGATFYLAYPVVDVVMADHESSWYVETPDGIHGDERWYRLGNIKTEVYDRLGIQDFDPLHRVVNYPIARYDGRVGANFGGAWMDGDDMSCMADGSPTYPYDKGGPAHCMGHVAHEIGHVLGLDHEGPDDDCMQYGFYDNVGGSGMCSFSAPNVATILANPNNTGWLDAEPGDTCVPAM